MAATTLNARCAFLQDSDIPHAAPHSLPTPKRFHHRPPNITLTCSATSKHNSHPTDACSTTSGMLMPMSAVGFGKGEGVVQEKMDEWMKESVVEIVKNLREAPLLVHVYNGGERRTLKGVEEECWVDAIDKWKRKEMPIPEGVIFVEKLDEDGEERSRAWGIVVQGRGCECGPVCYLLKTSRGGDGGALCCTHFCLMRVKSFRESASSQLNSCWLT